MGRWEELTRHSIFINLSKGSLEFDDGVPQVHVSIVKKGIMKDRVSKYTMWMFSLEQRFGTTSIVIKEIQAILRHSKAECDAWNGFGDRKALVSTQLKSNR